MIPLGAPKQRAVLAMLALEVGRTVSADRLADGLWGEQPPSSAPKMVQLYVSHLRRLLDGNGAQIVTRGRGYELRLADGDVDAVQFERLLEQARPREALALWHGEPLADVAEEPFAAAEIRRLGELRVRAAEMAIDADLEAGRHGEVIGELEALIGEHPLRERLHGQRMLALYRAGRQAEALDAYHKARAVLVEQIGVEPGAELQRLQEAIPAQDPTLELASPPPARAPPAARPPPRGAAPVFALAALLLFAGVVAFGDSRVTRPDSLARIDEDAVGVIDPDSGRITAQYFVGHSPEAVVSGAGAVWAANRLDGTVSRIDHEHEQVVTIDVGGEPTGLAFGAGSLWVANGEGRTVAQVDPETNKVERRIEVDNVAHAVAVGFGAVWVASAVDATVVRIDLNSGASRRIPVEARPSALAAGAGAIWVASDATARLIRLDPRSGTPLAPIPVGHGPSGVAVGAGAVWVANRRDGTVSRIDPATEVTETVRVGREPLAVAADQDGVWVANAGDGTVMRIDRAATGRPGRSRSRAAPPRWPSSTATCGPPRSPALPRTVVAPCASGSPPTRSIRSGSTSATTRGWPCSLDSCTTAWSATGEPAARRAGRSCPTWPATCRSQARTGGRTSSGCGRTFASPTERPSPPRMCARRSNACCGHPATRRTSRFAARRDAASSAAISPKGSRRTRRRGPSPSVSASPTPTSCTRSRR